MRIEQLNHVNIRTTQLDAMIEWYTNVLGMRSGDRPNFPFPGAWMYAGDSAALHLGWLWVRERHPAELMSFLTRTFRAYWALRLDASDIAAVAVLVDLLGHDGGEFQTWCADDGPATAAQLADELRERGLFGAPCYVVEDEVFLGRQHLPMIRWMLDGRRGPVPI